MSGIAGIIHFDRMPMQAGLIERMTASMAYRGPDGFGHWTGEAAALGHCQLRTTPESVDERQPLADPERSLVLVFDGRIDNSLELARQLRVHGAIVHGRTDSELLLRAYELWGPALLDRIEGDFSFAVWNPRERRLFCARDRIGNKPLHYFWNGRTFAFASDACALLALPWVEKQLNLDFIAENLASEWTSVEDTFWRGIHRLPAAHRLVVSAAGCKKSQYWHPSVDVSLPCRTTGEYAEYYRTLLFDVVRRMGRSSGPVACEVSGGLDSSALYAVAADLQRRGEWPAPDVHGYTLDFQGAGDADEMGYARDVARHVGKDVAEIAPTRQSLSWYEDWARQYGYPAGYPNGVMGLGIRHEARRRGSNCLLVGTGGDEWLDGYPTYYAEAIGRGHASELLQLLRIETHDLGAHRAFWRLLRYGVGPLLPARLRRAIRAIVRRPSPHDRWLVAPMMQRIRRLRDFRPLDPAQARRVGQRSQLIQLSSAYSLLARESEERLCAWAGLEIRRPFWDAQIVEFALTTPERLRLSGSKTKVLHRRAMAGLLPETVLTRTSKADFMGTFRTYQQELCSRLMQAAPALADWIHPEGLEQILRGYGNPQFEGWPEWQAWALFGCQSLQFGGGKAFNHL